MNPNKSKPSLHQFDRLYSNFIDPTLEDMVEAFDRGEISMSEVKHQMREVTLATFELLVDRKLK